MPELFEDCQLIDHFKVKCFEIINKCAVCVWIVVSQ